MLLRINDNIALLHQSPSKIMTRTGSKHGVICISKFIKTRCVLTELLIKNTQLLNHLDFLFLNS